jgi:hypothetical protein
MSFRFWRQIRGDIRKRKSIPRYQQLGELSALSIGDTDSRLLNNFHDAGVVDTVFYVPETHIMDFIQRS